MLRYLDERFEELREIEESNIEKRALLTTNAKHSSIFKAVAMAVLEDLKSPGTQTRNNRNLAIQQDFDLIRLTPSGRRQTLKNVEGKVVNSEDSSKFNDVKKQNNVNNLLDEKEFTKVERKKRSIERTYIQKSR